MPTLSLPDIISRPRGSRLVGFVAATIAIAAAVALTVSIGAQSDLPAAGAPAFGDSGQLTRPTDYREWIYLTSGLGMTYGPAAAVADRAPRFDNVFVTPASYREFVRTGKWPDRTMFILEVRDAHANVSINNGGRTQGAVVSIEAAVKDTDRFPDGWGYFSFDGPTGLRDTTAPLPQTATCYQCHKNNTAVENTFVQFYPTLFEVATAKGTVKATYDPNHKP